MSQLIKEVILQFKSEIQYQRFIKQCQKQFTINNFRLNEVSFQQAEAIYKELNQKYSNNYLQKLHNGWHQYERRLYIWFILCYMHYKLLDPIKFVHNQNSHKYWEKISRTFWNKNISLLQYQLLTIVKTKNRITWNKQQDQKLLQLYHIYPKGEWNEIAKGLFTQTNKKSFKTAKHCRQRWQNHLNPQIKKGQWKNEQDYKILYYVKLHGCKWSKIAQEFQKTRTQHMIKNRYKVLISKFKSQKNISSEQQIIIELMKQKQVLLKSRKSIIRKQKNKQKEKQKSKQTVRLQEQDIPFFQSQEIIDEDNQEDLRPKKINKTKFINKEQNKSFKLSKSNKSQTVLEYQNKSRNNSFFSSSFHRYNEDEAYKESNFLNNIPMNQLLFSSHIFSRQSMLLPGWQDKNISGFSKILGKSSSFAPEFQPFTSRKQSFINESIRQNQSNHIICNNQSVLEKYIKEIE